MKRIKKLKKSKKAISPIVAAVFLLVIAVAVGYTMFPWFKESVQDIAGQTETIQSDANKCLQSSILVSNVTIDPDGNISAIIENTGSYDLKVKSILAMDNETESCTMAFNPSIGAGRSAFLNMNCSNVFYNDCSDFKKLIVSTNCSGISSTFKSEPTCI